MKVNKEIVQESKFVCMFYIISVSNKILMCISYPYIKF